MNKGKESIGAETFQGTLGAEAQSPKCSAAGVIIIIGEGPNRAGTHLLRRCGCCCYFEGEHDISSGYGKKRRTKKARTNWHWNK